MYNTEICKFILKNCISFPREGNGSNFSIIGSHKICIAPALCGIYTWLWVHSSTELTARDFFVLWAKRGYLECVMTLHVSSINMLESRRLSTDPWGTKETTVKGSERSARYFAGFNFSFRCVSGLCIRASAHTFISGTSSLFRAVLRWIFKKWDVEVWTWSSRLRIGQVADTCECGNELSGSRKCGKFLDWLKTG